RPSVIDVQAYRLDDVLAGKEFGLVIMDIEGSESLALRGMPRILGAARSLVVEFMPAMMRNMGETTPEAFIGAIEPHFSRLFIPTTGRHVERAGFREVLGTMFERNESEAGLLFSKE